MEIIHEFLQQWVHTLWVVSWQVTVLFVLIGLISLLCWKSPANFRYWLWCIIVFRLSIPFNLSFPIGLGDDVGKMVTSLPSYVIEEPNYTPLSRLIEFRLTFPYSSTRTPKKSTNQTAMLADQTSGATGLPLISILSLFWLGLAMVMSIIIFLRVRTVRGLLKSSHIVERSELIYLLERLKNDLGIIRPIELRSLKLEVSMCPAIIGVFKPVVYLPHTVVQNWKLNDIEPVLLHELTHLKRRDILINWLQIITQVLYFFHPIVWYVNQKIRNLREDACDDAAIGHISAERTEYAEKMLRIVREVTNDKAPVFLAVGFAEVKSSLAKRIVRIMSNRYRNYPGITRFSIASLAILALISIVLASGKADKTVFYSSTGAIKSDTTQGRMVNFIRDDLALEEITAKLQTSGKLGMLYFTAIDLPDGSCGKFYCEELEKGVFSNDTVRAYIDSHFTPFLINCTGKKGADVKKHYEAYIVEIFIIDEKGELVEKLVNCTNKDVFLRKMSVIFETDNTLGKLKEKYDTESNAVEIAVKYGTKLFNTHEHVQAVRVYEKILPLIKNDSLKSHVFLHLGLSAKFSGQTRKAIEVWKKGVDEKIMKHRMEEGLAQLGALLFDEGEYEAAVHYLEMFPENYDHLILPYNWGSLRDFQMVRTYLGLAYLKTGQMKKGAVALEAQFEYYWNGNILYFDRKTNKYARYEKQDLTSIAELGYRCGMNDVYVEGALRWVEKAAVVAKDDPNYFYVLSSYAYLLDLNKQLRKSIEVTKTLIEIEKRDLFKKQFVRDLAYRLLKSGDETMLNKMISEAQNNPEQLFDLAFGSKLHKVRMEEGLAVAKKAIKLIDAQNKNYANYLYLYAELLYENKEYSEAVDALEKVIEFSPSQARPYYEEQLKKYEVKAKK